MEILVLRRMRIKKSRGVCFCLFDKVLLGFRERQSRLNTEQNRSARLCIMKSYTKSGSRKWFLSVEDEEDVAEEIIEEVSGTDSEEEVEYIYEIEYVEESEESEDMKESADSEESTESYDSLDCVPNVKKDQEKKHARISNVVDDIEDKQDVCISPAPRRSLSPIPAHRFIEESSLTPILSPYCISPRSKNVSFSTIHSVLTEDDEIIYVDENDDIFS